MTSDFGSSFFLLNRSQRARSVNFRFGSSSLSRISRNERRGMWRPITTRQTVSGVDSSKPTGPHNVVQTSAAKIRAKDKTPALVPYSHGSSTLLLINSSRRIRPMVWSGAVQSLETVSESRTGKDAAIHGPTYGKNRRTAASAPHSTAFGTPMKYKPIASGRP